jgi:hypothetical protein
MQRIEEMQYQFLSGRYTNSLDTLKLDPDDASK